MVCWSQWKQCSRLLRPLQFGLTFNPSTNYIERKRTLLFEISSQTEVLSSFKRNYRRPKTLVFPYFHTSKKRFPFIHLLLFVSLILLFAFAFLSFYYSMNLSLVGSLFSPVFTRIDSNKLFIEHPRIYINECLHIHIRVIFKNSRVEKDKTFTISYFLSKLRLWPLRNPLKLCILKKKYIGLYIFPERTIGKILSKHKLHSSLHYQNSLQVPYIRCLSISL